MLKLCTTRGYHADILERTDERRRYKTLSIPLDLYEEVEKFIRERPELGYVGVTELFKEALREKLLSANVAKQKPRK